MQIENGTMVITASDHSLSAYGYTRDSMQALVDQYNNGERLIATLTITRLIMFTKFIPWYFPRTLSNKAANVWLNPIRKLSMRHLQYLLT